MIVIVDYDSGNLGSIRNMLKRQGIKAEASDDPERIADADRLILPGVGSFDHGVKKIEERGLREVLDRRVVEDRVPILGMCLGGQLMTKSSEEGVRAGLGWVDADTVHLRKNFEDSVSGLRFPHIGWNFLYPAKEHPVLADLPEPPRSYFVHTFKMLCRDNADVLTRSRYGEIVFTSAFAHKNVIGVQFHPEKSHRYGMQLFANFAAWTPEGV